VLLVNLLAALNFTSSLNKKRPENKKNVKNAKTFLHLWVVRIESHTLPARKSIFADPGSGQRTVIGRVRPFVCLLPL